MSTKRELRLPREGTIIRQVADALIETKGRKYWWPWNVSASRAARTLRDEHGWPIEDRRECGSMNHEYRLDPERRGHFKFV